MPSSAASSHYSFFSIIFLAVFLVGLFPNLFHYLLTLPFALLFAPSTDTRAGTASPSNPTTALTPPPPTMWTQKQFSLPPRSRGSYLITDHVMESVPEIRDYKVSRRPCTAPERCGGSLDAGGRGSAGEWKSKHQQPISAACTC